MGPKCNHVYLYETEAKGETPRKGEGAVTTEPDTGAIQLQAKEQHCQEPGEARTDSPQQPLETQGPR